MRRSIVPRLVATLGGLALLSLPLTALAQDGGPNVDGAFATVLLDAYDGQYQEWAYEPDVPEGFYAGSPPHGMVLRTFVNDVAMADIAEGSATFSEGAVFVKENHMPTGVDVEALESKAPVEGFDGNLAAWTFMVKVPGYAPDSGDWFWAKIAADGNVDAAGTPAGCVGCHVQVEDNDWVFDASLGTTDAAVDGN